MISYKKIEIFCGTGGVGKTTLATSRALSLSKQGLKVLLITIDPAKRLKQVLGLDESLSGEVIPLKNQGEDFKNLSALLMNPRATLKRMTKLSTEGKELDNPIINILTKPYGGMNEIMAIIEVQYYLKTNDYDCIVLDTPPGKHFIDFLDSSKKIQQFFDKSFIDIFKFLGKKIGESEKAGFLSMLVQSGIKRLLKYLEQVTGENFVNEFIDAVSGLYNNRTSFTEALDFQQHLKRQDFSNWFLVTSVEQQKILEASNLKEGAERFMHSDSFLLVNKSLAPYIDTWRPSSEHIGLVEFREAMKARENAIEQISKDGFKSTLKFPEVLDSEPLEQVKNLTTVWTF